VSKKAIGPKNGVYERWAVEYSICPMAFWMERLD
jgi:hypothetical protein